jgi:hypothetical protein
MKHIRTIITIVYCFIFHNHLYSHGFGSDTLVTLLLRYKTAMCGKIIKQRMETAQTIEQIYESPINRHTKVKSYNEQSHVAAYLRVKAAGISCVNCYVRIEFNNDNNNIIECSPLQTFYHVDTQEWVPAYQLEPGDILFSESPSRTQISSVSLIEKPLRVYTLEVNKFHTFLVGKDKVLTHNMFLEPSLFLSLGFAFGEGAVVGGSTGSTFGPVAMGAGLALGGVIGIVTACSSQGRKKVEYQVDFDVHQLAHKQDSKKPKKDTKSTNDSENSENNGKKPDKDPNDERRKIDWEKTTNKQDREDAEKLGYKETKNPPFNARGRLTFKKNQTWISSDSTGHNGGRWKMFNNAGERMATCDKNLNFIKD